jgi:hypothetical protein
MFEQIGKEYKRLTYKLLLFMACKNMKNKIRTKKEAKTRHRFKEPMDFA